jgi:GTPase SAR1 family protein
MLSGQRQSLSPTTMSQAPTNVVTAFAFLERAFRIVLFGMPDAGKSSLLGAFAQAAQVQEHVLNAKLIDRNHGLMELQRRLYEDRPRETLEEVAFYPIVLEPFPTKDSQPTQPATEAILFDCDGRVANEVLARGDALTGDLGQRALVLAVLSADTLVLCVDVSAEAVRLKRDFSQFARFLRLLERYRGQRTEIAGLPVYLVLTKCDLLAQATDSTVQWMERIEDRKRTVHQKFQEFLAQQAAREQMPFGKINLHVWATAVKRPALADAPAKAREPYGAAELLRQCLDSARIFQQRRRQATQRLGLTLGVLGVLVVFMALLALFFVATQRETELGRLEKQIRSFRAEHSETPADRLKEPRDLTIKQLKHFQQDPLFDKMPEELRQFVAGHLQELETYDRYVRKFEEYRKKENLPTSPRDAQTDEELNKMAEALRQFPVPDKYKTEWEGTEAVRREHDWPAEIEAMRRHVKLATEKFDKLLKLAKDYRDYPDTGSIKGRRDILVEMNAILDNFPALNNKPEQRVPGSRVTYGDILRFDRVARKYAEWKEERDKLIQGGAKIN